MIDLQSPTVSRSEKYTRAFLAGAQKRGELLPGAADELAKLALGRGLNDTAATLAWLADFLVGDDGKRYLSVEHRPEAPEAPARAMLRRLESGGLLGKGKADEAFAQWAVDLSYVGDRPGQLARAIVDRLGRDEGVGKFLAERRPMLPTEEKVLAALKEFRADFFGRGRDDELEDLARQRDWSHLGTKPPHEIRRHVALRLASSLYADLSPSGEPLEFDQADERFRPQPGDEDPAATAEARREALGRIF